MPTPSLLCCIHRRSLGLVLPLTLVRGTACKRQTPAAGEPLLRARTDTRFHRLSQAAFNVALSTSARSATAAGPTLTSLRRRALQQRFADVHTAYIENVSKAPTASTCCGRCAQRFDLIIATSFGCWTRWRPSLLSSQRPKVFCTRRLEAKNGKNRQRLLAPGRHEYLAGLIAGGRAAYPPQIGYIAPFPIPERW